jgi:hypothetical protein
MAIVVCLTTTWLLPAPNGAMLQPRANPAVTKVSPGKEGRRGELHCQETVRQSQGVGDGGLPFPASTFSSDETQAGAPRARDVDPD